MKVTITLFSFIVVAVIIGVIVFNKTKRRVKNMDHFESLKQELPTLKNMSNGVGPNAFFAQEALRFYSIAGTIKDNFTLDEKAKTEERNITHILFRSLLENYFRILYIFDSPADIQTRYDSIVDNFKREYGKLLNEPLLPRKNELETAGSSWSQLPRGLDMNSTLAQVQNDYGDRLSYLYFVYRIASFDTHGNNIKSVAEDAFGKPCNFPVLKLAYAIDLVANQYLIVLGGIRDRGEI